MWWKECANGDIEFSDGKESPEFHTEGPVLHHFRSCNFKTEEKYLKDCWEMCLQNKALIPAVKLCIEDDNGNLVVENLVCQVGTDGGSVGGHSVGESLVDGNSVDAGAFGESLVGGGSVGGNSVSCGAVRGGSVGGGSAGESSVDGDSVSVGAVGDNLVGGGSVGHGLVGESLVNSGGSVGGGADRGGSIGGGEVIGGSVSGGSVANKVQEDDNESDVDHNVISFKESTSTNGSDLTLFFNDDTENTASRQSTAQGKIYCDNRCVV